MLASVPPPPLNCSTLQNAAAGVAVDTNGLLCALTVLNKSACGGTAPSPWEHCPVRLEVALYQVLLGEQVDAMIIIHLLPSFHKLMKLLNTTLTILATHTAATTTIFLGTGARCTTTR